MEICIGSFVPKTLYTGLSNGTPGHGRPLSGPHAHFYLRTIAQLEAQEVTWESLHPKDRAVLEYAIRARAEQANNRHKRSGTKGGQRGVGAVKSRLHKRQVVMKPWATGVDPRTGKRNGVRHPK